jgi:nitric oxide reductase NorQ protein
MSSSESDSTVDRPEPLVVLSHLVHRLLKREGGSAPLERVTLRVSDYVDIGDQEAADLIDAGAAEGVFTLTGGSAKASSLCAALHSLLNGDVVAVASEAFAGVKPDVWIGGAHAVSPRIHASRFASAVRAASVRL